MLAIISASALIGILYGLGGLSLYLRANFLDATPTPPAPDLTATLPPDQIEAPTLFPTLTPWASPTDRPGETAPTLYPTMTPRPGA